MKRLGYLLLAIPIGAIPGGIFAAIVWYFGVTSLWPYAQPLDFIKYGAIIGAILGVYQVIINSDVFH